MTGAIPFCQRSDLSEQGRYDIADIHVTIILTASGCHGGSLPSTTCGKTPGGMILLSRKRTNHASVTRATDMGSTKPGHIYIAVRFVSADKYIIIEQHCQTCFRILADSETVRFISSTEKGSPDRCDGLPPCFKPTRPRTGVQYNDIDTSKGTGWLRNTGQLVYPSAKQGSFLDGGSMPNSK